ncbi:MAG TPA: hypothetical protein VLG16_00595 [Candidatus Saccharimonadales bacterium]|nr:hypothetical protein [Candidatus Saccharimonadales bacterium]
MKFEHSSSERLQLPAFVVEQGSVDVSEAEQQLVAAAHDSLIQDLMLSHLGIKDSPLANKLDLLLYADSEPSLAGSRESYRFTVSPQCIELKVNDGQVRREHIYYSRRPDGVVRRWDGGDQATKPAGIDLDYAENYALEEEMGVNNHPTSLEELEGLRELVTSPETIALGWWA